ncbi:hypothetical protein HDU98_010541 [Podochytrium sp. JEL0797]|nr:hypothetical protein HDU98_010541 [Podochytrium sp. JEL0797]
MSQRESHRQAQARYRAKKEARIAELLQQVEFLNRHPTNQTRNCLRCVLEEQRLSEAMSYLRELTDKKNLLEARKASLLNHQPQHESVTIVDGSLRDLEIMRSELKKLSSLRDSPHVDELVNMIKEYKRERTEIQSLRVDYAKFNVMDTCALLERRNAIEIVEGSFGLFRLQTADVISPTHIVTTTTAIAPCVVAPVAMRSDFSFTELLMRIPSLRDQREILNRFCEGSWAWQGYSGKRTQKETQDHILRQNNFVRAIAKKCECKEDLIEVRTWKRMEIAPFG